MDWMGTQCDENSITLFSEACFQQRERNVGRVGCNDFQRGYKNLVFFFFLLFLTHLCVTVVFLHLCALYVTDVAEVRQYCKS